MKPQGAQNSQNSRMVRITWTLHFGTVGDENFTISPNESWKEDANVMIDANITDYNDMSC